MVLVGEYCIKVMTLLWWNRCKFSAIIMCWLNAVLCWFAVCDACPILKECCPAFCSLQTVLCIALLETKVISQQTRDVEPMLGWCWADVVDDRPTLYISFHLSPPFKSNPPKPECSQLFMINYWNLKSGKGVSLKCASLSGLIHSYLS